MSKKNNGNLSKKLSVHLRSDQVDKLEVLEMILGDELIQKYTQLDKAKFDKPDIPQKTKKDMASILIRLGLDKIFDDLSDDIQKQDHQPSIINHHQ